MSKAIDLANAIADDNKERFGHGWTTDNAKSLVSKIDDVIGFWPNDAKYLIFAHSDQREMRFAPKGFCRNGWWTDVLTAQEYHMIKAGLPTLDKYVTALQAAISIGEQAKVLRDKMEAIDAQ
jgi:hypothetical protein